VIVSRTKGFAVVTDAAFANSLVTFNPSTGQRLNTIVGPLNVFLPHLAINSRNELYLAVADARTPTPGLRIFDTGTDRELTPTPLNVGQLLPSWILFIE
jgi:hypothetical protein